MKKTSHTLSLLPLREQRCASKNETHNTTHTTYLPPSLVRRCASKNETNFCSGSKHLLNPHRSRNPPQKPTTHNTLPLIFFTELFERGNELTDLQKLIFTAPRCI